MPVSSTPVENVDMSQESVSVTAAPVTTVATLDGTDEASLAPSPDRGLTPPLPNTPRVTMVVAFRKCRLSIGQAKLFGC
jgi:hypothetical protein